MTRPTFHYPFHDSWPISSPYGPRGSGMHTGVDFAVPTGVDILAANDGEVIYAAYEGGAGNTVTVQGSDGWQSRYHHLERWVVHVGQLVRAGERVGVCDNTGSSTGPHLHFEIRSSPSVHVDPIPILEADAGASAPAPPAADTTTDEGDDTMLIVNRDTGAAAVLCGLHLPQKIASVNDYRDGTSVVLDAGAWQQYMDNAIKLHQAAVRSD